MVNWYGFKVFVVTFLAIWMAFGLIYGAYKIAGPLAAFVMFIAILFGWIMSSLVGFPFDGS